MDWAFVLHQTVCGAIAAAGFGVLFNVGVGELLWCGVTGALALAVRTICLDQGWSLEAASFLAALVVGCVVQALRARSNRLQNAFDVAGCIPMVPGSFAAKAILGLFALTVPNPIGEDQTLITAMEILCGWCSPLGPSGRGWRFRPYCCACALRSERRVKGATNAGEIKSMKSVAIISGGIIGLSA